ncbi:hypothetical protein CDAR_291381 [Caerostris darwini]|uniref:Uncharacterized protein n=1 Tax=Caerostris darwini TaxID=1538125 RepID=A0AAV4RP35_9ARAC|nr:hypothetical protein CDAR_291381 [Caerostris darwini]
MTRGLFLDSGIPNVLCADAVSTACYLRNKFERHSKKMLEKLWTRKSIQHDHLRTLRYKGIAEIDKSLPKRKLDRNVRFDETVFRLRKNQPTPKVQMGDKLIFHLGDENSSGELNQSESCRKNEIAFKGGYTKDIRRNNYQ